MTFLHLSLLAGGLLAIAPIAFHMLGRRQPKAVTFPAIRFVRETAIQAQKGWSIKRWLLLGLRVLLVLLAAFALAAPRVPSNMFATFFLIGMIAVFALLATSAAVSAIVARKSRVTVGAASLVASLLWLIGGGWFAISLLGGSSVALPASGGPIAAALVIDTSPSMGYAYRNQTRMAAAKEMAGWLMDRLPIGSQIAIVNSDSSVRLLQDRVSANRVLDKTIVEGKAAGLVQRITNSIDAVRKSELARREIYVLSDLNAAGWRDAENSTIHQLLAKNPDGTAVDGQGVLLQLIDVGIPPDEVKNWGIRKFALSQQTTVPGATVSISAEVEGKAGGGSEQMTVELLTEEPDRQLVVRNGVLIKPELRVVDRQLIDVPDGATVPVRFQWKELAEGTNHAQIKIARQDPLDVDNVVYLSVEARIQGQSLIVAADPRDAETIAIAIDPDGALSSADQRGETQSRLSKLETYSNLNSAAVPFGDYSNIVLFDPVQLDADTCDRLEAWVEQGGGLLILLGSSYKTAEELQSAPIHRLLPGTVKRITRRAMDDRSIVLTPAIPNHPMWGIFERSVEDIPWSQYPIFRHWDIEDLHPSAFPLMRFTESELPAIVEETRKRGRIITWAVPYPEPAGHDQGTQWSELYRTTAAEWPGYALFDGSVRYLASWNDQQLNYVVDQPALLENNISQMPAKYLMFDPSGEQSSVESGDESMIVNYTRLPGAYRLRGLRPQGPVVRGFSVNVSPEEIRLDRVPENVLRDTLGANTFRIAREKKEVESSLGEGRYGRELTPYLMVMLVMLFMAEQTMASRFYSSQTKGAFANRSASKTSGKGAA